MKTMKREPLKVYLDMDGVLCDFRAQVVNVGPCLHTEKFWNAMPWTEDGKKLWDFLKSYKPYVLSALPSKFSMKSFTGKRKWLYKNLGGDTAARALLVKRGEKHHYAKRGSILIDDSVDNIKAFRKAGGKGIVHKNAESTIQQFKKIML